LESFITLSTE